MKIKVFRCGRLTTGNCLIELFRSAEVAELADALRSGRSGHYAREGSNPSFGTLEPAGYCGFFSCLEMYFSVRLNYEEIPGTH